MFLFYKTEGFKDKNYLVGVANVHLINSQSVGTVY